MDIISLEIKVPVPRDLAYHKFISEWNEWWPKEYTWSREKLHEIKIDAKLNGLCTEIGPFGFRVDWGRVTKIKPNEFIHFTWQISPNREPIPNPENASEIFIQFIPADEANTKINFKHSNFENHGEGFAKYKDMMGSDQGWKYILEKFVQYCTISN